MNKQRYFVGLDLGQTHEFTAAAVLERDIGNPRQHFDRQRFAYGLRHLQRFPISTSYRDIAKGVEMLLQKPELDETVLLVDQTGVGAPVVTALKDQLKGRVNCKFFPVTLTAGHEFTHGDTSWCIPKKDMVGILQVLFQDRRLRVPRSLPDAHVFVRELINVRAKPALARNDPIEDWREGKHDDLVFAVALAAWAGETALPGEFIPPPDYEMAYEVIHPV